MPLSPNNRPPSAWIPTGYAFDATNNRISLSIGTGGVLPQVSSVEANPSTGGDICRLLWGLWDGLYNVWETKNASLDTADESLRVFFSRSYSFTSDTRIEARYNIRVEVAASGLEVLAENIALAPPAAAAPINLANYVSPLPPPDSGIPEKIPYDPNLDLYVYNAGTADANGIWTPVGTLFNGKPQWQKGTLRIQYSASGEWQIAHYYFMSIDRAVPPANGYSLIGGVQPTPIVTQA